MVSPQSRFHRTVKKLNLTETEVSKETLADLRAHGLIQGQEEIIGIYKNRAPGHPIFFTTEAVVIQEAKSYRRIPYATMERSIIDAPQKELATDVLLRCKDGNRVTLKVHGGDERSRDVFEIGRFLARVIEDHASQQ